MTGAAARMRHAALLIPLAACLTAGLAAAGCHRERGGTHPASEMSRSTDEGVSWQPLASGETRPLFSVAFAPARRGVAVGSHRLVLETADGGFTWTRRDLGTDRQLFLVRFAKGGGRFILGEFGILWRTDDGGANWMPVELPWDELLPALTAQFGLVEPHLYDIAFSSARGWQVRECGLILSTTDGGRTWISSEAVESSTRTSSPSRVKAKMRWSAAASAASCCSAPMAARRGLSSAATGGTCTTSSRFDLDSEVLAIGDRGSLMMSRRSGAPGSWQTVPNAGAHTGQPWFGRGRSIGSEVLLVGQLRVERLSLDVIASVAATWRRE